MEKLRPVVSISQESNDNAFGKTAVCKSYLMKPVYQSLAGRDDRTEIGKGEQ
ncbi:hypothetical protein Slin15195_G100430 [Septoria linicola]|uniref:Uncharacterized protein n=1 Tax=Septoria linicola TaxID=215465 RepID=A0A9Q9AX92_9PEZI|nr:hypothetical protein Slin15195_G100430 [Septoria linicola]